MTTGTQSPASARFIPRNPIICIMVAPMFSMFTSYTLRIFLQNTVKATVKTEILKVCASAPYATPLRLSSKKRPHLLKTSELYINSLTQTQSIRISKFLYDCNTMLLSGWCGCGMSIILKSLGRVAFERHRSTLKETKQPHGHLLAVSRSSPETNITLSLMPKRLNDNSTDLRLRTKPNTKLRNSDATR
jgi:hypothetical protein